MLVEVGAGGGAVVLVEVGAGGGAVVGTSVAALGVSEGEGARVRVADGAAVVGIIWVADGLGVRVGDGAAVVFMGVLEGNGGNPWVEVGVGV